MAVWWRSSHERPYSDRAKWRRSAGNAWWGSNDWREDNPEGWKNEQEYERREGGAGATPAIVFGLNIAHVLTPGR